MRPRPWFTWSGRPTVSTSSDRPGKVRMMFTVTIPRSPQANGRPIVAELTAEEADQLATSLQRMAERARGYQ